MTSHYSLFVPGDLVRVRSLAELQSEFGEAISTPCNFTTMMREYCGKTMKVTSVGVTTDGNYFYYRLDEGDGWNFDECVLEDAATIETIGTPCDPINYDDLF